VRPSINHSDHSDHSGPRRPRRRRALGVAAGAAGLLAGALMVASPAGASVWHSPTAGAVKPDLYGFKSPDASAVSGGDLFVANRTGNSVTELNASSGAHVRTLSGSPYDFDAPTALKAIGADLFVANGHAGLTELAIATGAFVATMRGPKFAFSDPIALATNGSNSLYVLSASGSVTQVSTATRLPIGIASGKQFGFNHVAGIICIGSDLFVTNSGANSVTEINADTMKLVKILSGSRYSFDKPIGITGHGDDLWVTNNAGQSLTELLTTGGAVQVVPNGYLPAPGPIVYGDGDFFVASPPGSSPMITQVIPTKPAGLPWMMCNTNGPYDFSNPQALAIYGNDLWVINEGGAGDPPGNSLTEMNASTGTLIQTIP
jgi:hypothetical protein